MGIATNKMRTEERRKYFLAKAWWPKRNQLITRGEITYSQRFEEMYGETLEDYRAALRAADGQSGADA